MSIIAVIVIIIIVGFLLWLANAKIPMDPTVKMILNAVVILLLVLWILSLFFNLGSIGHIGTSRIG